jgi:hypothetical protein
LPFCRLIFSRPSPSSLPKQSLGLPHGCPSLPATIPRREFLQRLRDWLPDAGSIVVYNAAFELDRLKECCQLNPDFQPWLANVESRMFDLLKPFRAFRYYAPGQGGSASMKAVLPAPACLTWPWSLDSTCAGPPAAYDRFHLLHASNDARLGSPQRLRPDRRSPNELDMIAPRLRSATPLRACCRGRLWYLTGIVS